MWRLRGRTRAGGEEVRRESPAPSGPKEVESLAGRDRRNGRPADDVGWLWPEVGAGRPE